MKNKIVLITGATSGIGKVTAVELSKKGATVVFLARNKEKAEQTKNEILALNKEAVVNYILCDFSSLQSVKEAADQFNRQYDRLDVLINNAGVWLNEKQTSKDGFEMTFAVNHLAPFLLTNLVLNKLKATPNSRIVTTSSGLHYQGKINFDDLQSTGSGYSGYSVYCNSKLMNALFTKHLSKLLKNNGITANCLHPGVVRTSLFDTAGFIAKNLLSLLMVTPEKGARTSIYLASSNEVANISGEYFDKCKVKKAAAIVYDEAVAEKLWNVSTDLVKQYL